ncbi:MAG: hypothetical protein ACRDIB_01230, partial [Ardenticatenaceae bacterium]
RPVTDTALPEPEYTLPGWWPTIFYALNSFQGEDGLEEYIVVNPGQFGVEDGIPIQRVYTEFSFEVYHSSNDADRQPPSIGFTYITFDETSITFTVQTEDPSGIDRVLVSYTEGVIGKVGAWQSVELTRDAVRGDLYHATVAVADPLTVEYFVQSVDTFGNVRAYTDKTEYFSHASDQILPLPLLRPALFVPLLRSE